jgi:hypothetical protein
MQIIWLRLHPRFLAMLTISVIQAPKQLLKAVAALADFK